MLWVPFPTKLSDDRIVRRHMHADHVRPYSEDLPEESIDNALDETIPITVSD